LAKQNKQDNKPNKIFVLDTNVLLHDPQCLQKFEDNTIAIPVEVLEELDRKKSAPGELGFSARKIHRDLRLLFDTDLEDDAKLKEAFRSALSCTLPTGGQLIVVINDFLINTQESESLNRLRATLFDLDKMDSRILASVFFLKEICDDQRVILVTKDANMALKGI
jgi:PhoH-like ATPase